MRIIVLLVFFLSLFVVKSFAQGDLDEQKKIFFRNEKTYALNLNTNGFGFDYRFAKRKNASRKFIYDGDINIMKHQKEYKQYNPWSYSLTRFAYGKTNSVFNIRFGVGQEFEIFKKLDKNSVSVRLFYAGGFTSAFLKPIYYQILVNEYTVDKKFDTSVPALYIMGRSPYSMGISETKIIPGAYVKTGFGFEFSQNDNRVSMIEAGITLELYPKTVEIMATETNKLFFPTLYISYRFGKVISDFYMKERDKGEEEY
jgi:hypothetical protein